MKPGLIIVVIPCLKPDFTFITHQLKRITLLFFLSFRTPSTHFSTEPNFPLVVFSKWSLLQLSHSFYSAMADHWGIEEQRITFYSLSLSKTPFTFYFLDDQHALLYRISTSLRLLSVPPLVLSVACQSICLFTSVAFLHESTCMWVLSMYSGVSFMHAYILMCFYMCMQARAESI